jgi:hypothetical protein
VARAKGGSVTRPAGRRFFVSVARAAARLGESHCDGSVFAALVEGPIASIGGRHADRGEALRTALAFYRRAARRKRENKV